MRQNRRENSSTPRLIIIIIIDISTRFLRYLAPRLALFFQRYVVVVVLGCLGFFFFFSSFVFFVFFDFFLTKKNRDAFQSFDTTRTKTRAMPIGDGTTVTGTTIEEEEEDVIIKARRKKDDDGRRLVFERASVRVD